MHTLAIDLGKTGCRVVRRDATGEKRFGQGAGALGMSHPEGPASALAAIERALAAGTISDRGLDTVCLGAAGVSAAPENASVIAQLLADRFHSTALVTSDAVTSHAGSLGGEAGVVLAVGTGAAAITLDTLGQLVQVDGRGQSLGDEGSGYWFGREGLIAAFRSLDERGPLTRLQADAEREFGELHTLPARLGGADAAIPALAAFAPWVLAAAEAGDAVAEEILERGIDALGATVAAAVRKSASTESVRCCLVGGLSQWPEHFRLAVQHAAATRSERTLSWCAPKGTALDGAQLIATDATLPHRQVCVTAQPRAPIG